jgi:hypothetical protein
VINTLVERVTRTFTRVRGPALRQASPARNFNAADEDVPSRHSSISSASFALGLFYPFAPLPPTSTSCHILPLGRGIRLLRVRMLTRGMLYAPTSYVRPLGPRGRTHSNASTRPASRSWRPNKGGP